MELYFELGSASKKKECPGRKLNEFFNNRRLKLPSGTVSIPYGSGKNQRFAFSVSEDLISRYEDGSEIRRILQELNSENHSPFLHCNDSRKEHLLFFDAQTGRMITEKDGKDVYNLFLLKKDLNKQLQEPDQAVYKDMLTLGIIVRSVYVSLEFSQHLMNAFSHLFLYSYLSYQTNRQPEAYERLRLELDIQKKTLTLTDMSLLHPDAEALEAFLRRRYVGGYNPLAPQAAHTQDKPKNFYLKDSVSGWVRFDKNSFTAPHLPGIYMLFDSKRNELYVGKAKDLYKRILAHRIPGPHPDPIPDFDFYRFSCIEPGKTAELFILENTAIHDLAMIFEMREGSSYGSKALNLDPALCGIPLGDIKLVNTAETQTKWEKENG